MHEPIFHADPAELRYLGLARNHPSRGSAAARARWLVRYFQSRAYLDVEGWNADAVAERFHLTERTVDACFEMGDGDLVLDEFMPVVLADPSLTNAVRVSIGEKSFTEWSAHADRQPSLL